MIRRLAPFALALSLYVLLAVVLRSVALNWVVGPLFLLIVLDVLPRALGRSPLFTLDLAPESDDTSAT
jgi:hypothetical protein